MLLKLTFLDKVYHKVDTTVNYGTVSESSMYELEQAYKKGNEERGWFFVTLEVDGVNITLGTVNCKADGFIWEIHGEKLKYNEKERCYDIAK